MLVPALAALRASVERRTGRWMGLVSGCSADAWRMLGGCSSKPKDQKREMPRPNKLQVAPEA